jgi:hypothetical protein
MKCKLLSNFKCNNLNDFVIRFEMVTRSIAGILIKMSVFILHIVKFCGYLTWYLHDNVKKKFQHHICERLELWNGRYIGVWIDQGRVVIARKTKKKVAAVRRDNILCRHRKNTLKDITSLISWKKKHCYASRSLLFKWHRKFLDRKDSLEDYLHEGRQYFRDSSAAQMTFMTWLTVKGDYQLVKLRKSVELQRLRTWKIIPWSKYESCLCSFGVENSDN